MPAWVILDYVEKSGRNPIRDWLDSLDEDDRAKIDRRLLQMIGLPRWPEKWASKYKGYDEIFELRITGNKVQYRPLYAYFGRGRLILLVGAIERGNKIPKSDLETAVERLNRVKQDASHAQPHNFDDEGDLEENA